MPLQLNTKEIALKIAHKPLLAGLLLALALPFAVNADMPGKHPAYLHALSDLRTARWMLEHRPGDAAVSAREDVAVAEIDASINEIKHAAIDDGKNPRTTHRLTLTSAGTIVSLAQTICWCARITISTMPRMFRNRVACATAPSCTSMKRTARSIAPGARRTGNKIRACPNLLTRGLQPAWLRPSLFSTWQLNSMRSRRD